MPSLSSRVLSILLFSVITMLFAEVISGSSILWFLSISGLLVTFPFYIVNSLFFINLVYRWKKTSLSGLYFAGVLYGAYEFWFTTVPLYGYINKQPVLGAFMGISVFEYFALVYFWHPIMSFIATVSLYQFFAIRKGETLDVIDGAQQLLTRSTKANLFWLLIMVLGSFILMLYSSLNIFLYYLGYVGTLIIIYALYHIRSRQCDSLALEDLIFRGSGFKALSALVPILYALGFFYHTGFKIAHPEAMIVVLLTYILGIWGLKFAKGSENINRVSTDQLVNVTLYLLVPIVLGLAMLFSIGILYQIGILLYLSLLPIGILTLLWFLIEIWREHQ